MGLHGVETVNSFEGGVIQEIFLHVIENTIIPRMSSILFDSVHDKIRLIAFCRISNISVIFYRNILTTFSLFYFI